MRVSVYIYIYIYDPVCIYLFIHMDKGERI
jgi:hypothetical protein